MDVFGFEDLTADFNKLIRNSDDAMPEVRKIAIKMRDRARIIAKVKGLQKTGAGVAGIEIEENDDSVDIGWSARPGLHLFFHEIGFHALDNRRGKARLKRNTKGNRARIYSGTGATYVAPKPHIRPAFDESKEEFYKTIQKTLEKGV